MPSVSAAVVSVTLDTVNVVVVVPSVRTYPSSTSVYVPVIGNASRPESPFRFHAPPTWMPYWSKSLQVE